MDRDALEALAHEWMGRVWRAREVEAVDALHAPEFVDRSPAGRRADCAGYKAGLRELFAAFPDWYASAYELYCDERRAVVTVCWVGEGTHRGPLLGCEPSGRRVRFVGIDMVRAAGGRIVERWGEWDGLDLLAQLAGDGGA